MSEVYKKYVDVIVCDNADGTKEPIAIWWDKDVLYKIDKFTDVHPRASMKAGGSGIRYTCMIDGHEKFLWYEEDRWFVEAKGEEAIDEHSTVQVSFWMVYSIQQNMGQ